MTTPAKQWFEVDRAGLAEIVNRRGGKAWLIQELISNGWDEADVTRVDVKLEAHEGRPMVDLSVTDDSPNGFANLSHAWTLFAKSQKRGNVNVRGRFNLGEKLVLAFCQEASITTTTGSVTFDHRGRTISSRHHSDVGSEFFGIVRMTRAELAQALADLKRLIPPAHIATTINGERLVAREVFASWEARLWSETTDTEGMLTRSLMPCTIRTFKPLPGETPMIYEQGIPVVELDGDPLHVDVSIKIPLDLERSSVTPAYLRALRAEVLKHTHAKLDTKALTASWATDAMASPNVPATAIETALTARFGADRVSADPSDREAENTLKARGHTIVHGGSLPGDVWSRVRELGLMKPAGQVAPTPKPYADDAPPFVQVAFESLSSVKQAGILRYRAVCRVLLGHEIKIVCADEPTWSCLAVWHQGKRLMVLNTGRLDEVHFSNSEAIYALALHEIAHELEGNHLSERYHEEICRLAGKLAVACATDKIELQILEYA